jgi:hypothetical protein
MTSGENYIHRYDEWSDGYPPDWQDRRRKVLHRDNYRCRNCGDKFVPENDVYLDIDHKIPKSDGGSHSLDNLQSLCRQCHAAKHPNNRKLSRRADTSPHFIVAFFTWLIGLLFRNLGETEDFSLETDGISDISVTHERAHATVEVDQLWDPNTDSMRQVGLLRNGDEKIKFISWENNEVKRLREGGTYRIEYASVEEYRGEYDSDVQLNLDTYTEIESA